MVWDSVCHCRRSRLETHRPARSGQCPLALAQPARRHLARGHRRTLLPRPARRARGARTEPLEAHLSDFWVGFRRHWQRSSLLTILDVGIARPDSGGARLLSPQRRRTTSLVSRPHHPGRSGLAGSAALPLPAPAAATNRTTLGDLARRPADGTGLPPVDPFAVGHLARPLRGRHASRRPGPVHLLSAMAVLQTVILRQVLIQVSMKS